MGTDIHTWAIDKDGNDITNQGNWGYDVDCDYHRQFPFDWRSYAMYGLLAGVRGYLDIEPIAQGRAWKDAPEFLKEGDECEESLQGETWVSVDELSSFNYDIEVFDTRSHSIVNLRKFLGSDYFDHIEELKRIGVDKVFMAFY